MDVDFDFSDVDAFFDEGEWEVEKKMIDVGDEAVKYAEEHGDYQDHTLTLRIKREDVISEKHKFRFPTNASNLLIAIR